MDAWVAQWWAGLWGTSIELACVALVIAVCLRLTRRWAPGVRWAIAAVVLVKMALPTTTSPTSLMRMQAMPERAAWVGAVPWPTQARRLDRPAVPEAHRAVAAATLPGAVVPTVEAQEPAERSVAGWAFAAYLCGVCIVLALGIADMVRFWRRAASARPIERNAERVWRGLGGRGPTPRVLCSPLVARPMCFGVFRPTVLLPDAARTSREEELIVAHEFGHLLHRDALRNVVHWLLAACWWFHPAAWWVGGRLRRIQEDRCDDAVLGWTADPVAYGDTLIQAVRHEHGGHGPSLSLGMAREHQLAPRLRRIFDPSVSRRTRLMQRLLPCLLILAAAAAPTDVRSQRASDGGAPSPDGFTDSTAATQDPDKRSVEAALGWLAKAQRENGSFADGDDRSTALAVLAFLASGQTAQAGPQAGTVQRAMTHLRRVLESEGDHPQELAMSAAAVAEHGVLSGAAGLSRSQLDRLAERARSEAVRPREAFWLAFSLITSSQGGAALDTEALAALRRRLPLGHATPDVGWSAETTCAASIMLHLVAGGDAQAEGFARAVERVLGAAARDLSSDPALVQFGTMALYQVGGSAWRAWMAGVEPQMKLGQDGSVSQGDRVASTAFMALALATRYRYARLVR